MRTPWLVAVGLLVGAVAIGCSSDNETPDQLFETVWNIPDSERTLVLPYYDDGSGSAMCDFTILWGDEGAGNDFSKGTYVTDCSNKNSITHTYPAAGTYHVKIKGVYNGWGLNPYDGDRRYCEDYCDGHVLQRLEEVVSFGPVGLTAGAFVCTNRVKLPAMGVPDARLWHNGRVLFACAEGIGDAITQWDTSNVTDMNKMFAGTVHFNQPLNTWDTSNVTDMSGMFSWSTFNQPLDTWNTSNVTDMSRMFFGAVYFDQPLNTWDTSNVTDMSEMFWGTLLFNQPLDTWNISNVTDMHGMFERADAFNQPLNTWNTSNVTNLSEMFHGATAFNQPLNAWNTSNVTNMRRMFGRAAAFDQNLALWNVAKVTDMDWIFSESGITQPNYCAVKSLPVWNNADLGISFNCP